MRARSQTLSSSFDSAGGHVVKKGSYLLLSPYATHRNTTFFDRPEEFDPSRFLPGGRAEDAVRNGLTYGYFPFGGGSRSCIGVTFAMLEMKVRKVVVL